MTLRICNGPLRHRWDDGDTDIHRENEGQNHPTSWGKETPLSRDPETVGRGQLETGLDDSSALRELSLNEGHVS